MTNQLSSMPSNWIVLIPPRLVTMQPMESIIVYLLINLNTSFNLDVWHTKSTVNTKHSLMPVYCRSDNVNPLEYNDVDLF